MVRQLLLNYRRFKAVKETPELYSRWHTGYEYESTNLL